MDYTLILINQYGYEDIIGCATFTDVENHLVQKLRQVRDREQIKFEVIILGPDVKS